MKTIVRKDSNISLYLLQDDTQVIIGASSTQVGSPAEFMVGDCTADNAVLHEGVTAPGDWAGCKYLFDGTTWTPNPDYVAPKPE